LRAAEDEQMGWRHREADAFGFVAMVNLGEEGQMVALNGGLQAF
jgi:hypothetical protein